MIILVLRQIYERFIIRKRDPHLKLDDSIAVVERQLGKTYTWHMILLHRQGLQVFIIDNTDRMEILALPTGFEIGMAGAKLRRLLDRLHVREGQCLIAIWQSCTRFDRSQDRTFIVIDFLLGKPDR